MENKIQDTEDLYRAIKRSKPDWLDNNGKPTSAMFKDANGNSVDRDDDRDLKEIIEFMDKGIFYKRLKGIVKINAGICMKNPIQAKVEAAPTESNPYHANIFTDIENERKAAIQALMLADNCVVVYINRSMAWVNNI